MSVYVCVYVCVSVHVCVHECACVCVGICVCAHYYFCNYNCINLLEATVCHVATPYSINLTYMASQKMSLIT